VDSSARAARHRLTAQIDIVSSLSAVGTRFEFLDHTFDEGIYSLEWHAGRLWVGLESGKIYRRDGYNDYTLVVTAPLTWAWLKSYGGELYCSVSESVARIYRLVGESLELEQETSAGNQPLIDNGAYLFWTASKGVEFCARRDGPASWTWGVGPSYASDATQGKFVIFDSQTPSLPAAFSRGGSTITKTPITLHDISGGWTKYIGAFDSQLWLPWDRGWGSDWRRLLYLESYAGGWYSTDLLVDSNRQLHGCLSADPLLLIGWRKVGATWFLATFTFDGESVSDRIVTSGTTAYPWTNSEIKDFLWGPGEEFLYVAHNTKIYRIPH
jgi:hypothetical protein